MISEKAPAKINLSLDVLRRREDGYHDLRMVMQTVSLYDELTMTPLEAPVFPCVTNLNYLPTGDKNLVSQAARLYYERAKLPGGLRINLRKRIPVGAGLGGGSADAAAVLRALNRTMGRLSQEELYTIALLCGSDVPFCLEGGTQLAEGRGEILSPLPSLPPCGIVLCKIPASVSTASIFHSYRLSRNKQRPDTKGIVDALERRALPDAARRMFNVLESHVTALHKDIAVIRKTMIAQGALGAVMSGSGPTVVGLFPDSDMARPAYDKLKSQYPETFLNCSVST